MDRRTALIWLKRTQKYDKWWVLYCIICMGIFAFYHVWWAILVFFVIAIIINALHELIRYSLSKEKDNV